MKILYIGLDLAAFLAVAVLVISYVCFRMAFYVSEKNKKPKEEYPIPKGEIYEPYRDKMVGWIKEVRAMPCEEFHIRSFDGLRLRGKYYEYAPGAIIEIMFHGYRGSAERDMCGGVQRCFKLGHSALIVDQRCAGKSGGNVITFGINESRDCLDWMRFAIDHFGPDCRLILTGISMGASTVMIAAGEELPKNVIGVLADCGFTSAKAIIKKVIRQIGLPPALVYPFIKLGARLYGHFDLEETTPETALKSCKIPVICFHGESDNFVPCQMSKINYEACPSKKMLVTIPDAGHGLSYLVGHETYMKAVREFFGEEGSATK
jgi:fermentation-respiration switch protein FrsA (DUF1100 family)